MLDQFKLRHATDPNSGPWLELPDGRAIWIRAMTFGKGRLCIGSVDNLWGYDQGFCYQSLEAAFAAAESWDGRGEPQGWFKNLQTGRYRKNGDPAKEYGPDDLPPE